MFLAVNQFTIFIPIKNTKILCGTTPTFLHCSFRALQFIKILCFFAPYRAL